MTSVAKLIETVQNVIDTMPINRIETKERLGEVVNLLMTFDTMSMISMIHTIKPKSEPDPKAAVVGGASISATKPETEIVGTATDGPGSPYKTTGTSILRMTARDDTSKYKLGELILKLEGDGL